MLVLLPENGTAKRLSELRPKVKEYSSLSATLHSFALSFRSAIECDADRRLLAVNETFRVDLGALYYMCSIINKMLIELYSIK